MNWKRLRCMLGGFVTLLVGIQFVPYGHDHTNPPVSAEPRWSSTEAEALARRTCYNCHSNETDWPWYSHVAPLSWVIQSHVDHGRHELNFSEWDRDRDAVSRGAGELLEGSMPPPIYLLLHGEAKLSDDQKATLAEALDTLAGKG